MPLGDTPVSDDPRDLHRLTYSEFDILIIGGGITGATIAWDAALRGLDVALIEMKDFSHATSSASSKLVHGGLRYLKGFEFGLVRESLQERRIWEIIAPHMVYPLKFLIPTKSKKQSRILSVGLTLYDLLAYDRNWLNDPDQKMPRHRKLSVEQTLALEPKLQRDQIAGGLTYYDCQMYAPERLGLECILGAEENGAHIANYVTVQEYLKEGRSIKGVRALDQVTGEILEIKSKITVNAAGPWADIVLDWAEDAPPSRKLVRSKGIHIIVKKLTDEIALALETTSGGHIFVLPWRDHSIIGTTDTVFDGKPEEVCATEGDILGVLDDINSAWVGLNLKRDDVLHAYAGLRPLIDTDNEAAATNEAEDSYNASRAAEIIDHEEADNIPGLFSAMGGKWTTARNVAEQAVDLFVDKLGSPVSAYPCRTRQTRLIGGSLQNFKQFLDDCKGDYPNLASDSIEILARTYGSRIKQIMKLARDAPELGARLTNDRPEIAAQIMYAIRSEHALTLEDVIFRRTGLGTLGHPGLAAVENVADLMAEELDWSSAEKAQQISIVLRRFDIPSDGTVS